MDNESVLFCVQSLLAFVSLTNSCEECQVRVVEKCDGRPFASKMLPHFREHFGST